MQAGRSVCRVRQGTLYRSDPWMVKRRDPREEMIATVEIAKTVRRNKRLR